MRVGSDFMKQIATIKYTKKRTDLWIGITKAADKRSRKIKI